MEDNINKQDDNHQINFWLTIRTSMIEMDKFWLDTVSNFSKRWSDLNGLYGVGLMHTQYFWMLRVNCRWSVKHHLMNFLVFSFIHASSKDSLKIYYSQINVQLYMLLIKYMY